MPNYRIYDRSRRPSSSRWSKTRRSRRSPASARWKKGGGSKRKGGVCCAFGFDVARHVFDPEGGRRAGRARRRPPSEHTPDESPQKTNRRGARSAPTNYAQALASSGTSGRRRRRRCGGTEGQQKLTRRRLRLGTPLVPYSASDFRWTARRLRCPARCATTRRVGWWRRLLVERVYPAVAAREDADGEVQAAEGRVYSKQPPNSPVRRPRRSARVITD